VNLSQRGWIVAISDIGPACGPELGVLSNKSGTPSPRKLAIRKTTHTQLCGFDEFPGLPASKADLVPLDRMLEVLPDQRRQALLAVLHAIHRHAFGRVHQALQVRWRNAL
jgi:hypothetical protein